MIGIDLFSGAGGMSLGAIWAGIDVQYAVDADRHAARTYAANHKSTAVFSDDIRKLNATHLKPWKKRHDDLIVFGGPPCQGFSWSNLRTRNLQNEANWLFEEFLRVVRILRPAWVVFENVQGVVNTASGAILARLIQELSKDYRISHRLLNAMDYGVAQDRTRFFLVGSRVGVDFSFPKPSSNVPVTVDQAIRDLPRIRVGEIECNRTYGRAIPSTYGRRLRGNLGACCNHLVTWNAPYVLERYKHVPQGGNWQNIPSRLMRNYKDRTRCHTGIYHRLRPEEPSIVIGNFRKNMLIHPTEDRGLSVREAARIQSFPDWYTFFGSIGFQQQQVGNAVPPLLAKAVFRSIVRQTPK